MVIMWVNISSTPSCLNKKHKLAMTFSRCMAIKHSLCKQLLKCFPSHTLVNQDSCTIISSWQFVFSPCQSCQQYMIIVSSISPQAVAILPFELNVQCVQCKVYLCVCVCVCACVSLCLSLHCLWFPLISLKPYVFCHVLVF